MGTISVDRNESNRQHMPIAGHVSCSGEALIELLSKIGDVVVEPWREGTTIDKNVAALCTGLIRQIDFGVAPAPIVLLSKPSCHLSRNALQPAEAVFQEAQHLPVDWVPLIPNDDPRELIVHRHIENPGHLGSCE